MSIKSGRAALAAAELPAHRIGALIHGSVCRDHLEPATACRVHHELELPNECTIYDVRPASCRAHHSLDVKRCELALSENYTTFPQNAALCKLAAAYLAGFSYVCMMVIPGRSKPQKQIPWRQSFFAALVLKHLEMRL